jgi:hypothetical protein
MILAGLIGLLALFSLLSIVVGAEDPRQNPVDPRSDTRLWMLGIR